MVMFVVNNWNIGVLVNEVIKFFNSIERGLIIVLQSKAALDIIGNKIPIVKELSNSHRLVLVSCTNMNIDLVVMRARKAHKVKNVGVDSKILDGIGGHRRVRRGELVERTGMKSKTLTNRSSIITTLTKHSSNLLNIRKVVNTILGSPREHIGGHTIKLDIVGSIPNKDGIEITNILVSKLSGIIDTTLVKGLADHSAVGSNTGLCREFGKLMNDASEAKIGRQEKPSKDRVSKEG
jgi:hypothetical protein